MPLCLTIGLHIHQCKNKHSIVTGYRANVSVSRTAGRGRSFKAYRLNPDLNKCMRMRTPPILSTGALAPGTGALAPGIQLRRTCARGDGAQGKRARGDGVQGKGARGDGVQGKRARGDGVQGKED